jgi:hypothetical protein
VSKPPPAISLLVRRTDPVRWVLWRRFDSAAEAEAEYETRIRGKGITAWTWIGATDEADKMLLDPEYLAPEGVEHQ